MPPGGGRARACEGISHEKQIGDILRGFLVEHHPNHTTLPNNRVSQATPCSTASYVPSHTPPADDRAAERVGRAVRVQSSGASDGTQVAAVGPLVLHACVHASVACGAFKTNLDKKIM